jgi:hypothetical protein
LTFIPTTPAGPSRGRSSKRWTRPEPARVHGDPMTVTGVSRTAAFGAATGSQVPAAPAAPAWPATPSDPAWIRAPTTRGISALLVADETAGDQLNRTRAGWSRSSSSPDSSLPPAVVPCWPPGRGSDPAGRCSAGWRLARRRVRPIALAYLGGRQVRARRPRRRRRGCAGPRCRGLVRAPGKALLTAPHQ